MLKKSSSSTTAGRAWRTGIVEPGREARLPAPGDSSMYFRPSDERGRTSSGRVGRQRLDLLVELHRDLRVGGAVRRRFIGSIFEMKPTRAPPMRTSKPFTSWAAFGRLAFRS